MDSPDINTAQKYVLINNQGIAFGSNGFSNPPEIAIGIDGSVVSGTGFFNSLTTNLIQSDIGQRLDLRGNGTVGITVVESEAYKGDLADRMKFFEFKTDGLHIKSLGSSELLLSDKMISFLTDGVTGDYWENNWFHSQNIVVEGTALIGNHRLEKYGDGTAIRYIGG